MKNIILLLSFAVLALACEKQGPAEKAGESLDEAAEELREGAAETQNEVDDALDAAKDAAEEATDEFERFGQIAFRWNSLISMGSKLSTTLCTWESRSCSPCQSPSIGKRTDTLQDFVLFHWSRLQPAATRLSEHRF